MCNEEIKIFNNDFSIFNGYYETSISLENVESYYNAVEFYYNAEENSNFEIPHSEVQEYYSTVAKSHVENIKTFLSSIKDTVIKDISYISLHSPEYYNYSTDSIEMKITYNKLKLEKYCLNTCKKEFSIYLKDNYTSCEGFISFVESGIKLFKTKFKDTDFERYIQVMLEFYLINNLNFEYVHEATFESALNCFMEMCKEVQ